jgi:hypothetical protein
MPDLTRDQIRTILQYLEDTTEVNYRHMDRVFTDRNAVLKGVPDTEKERKFGNIIHLSEQKDFFEMLKDEMQLEGRARQQFDWAFHSRNISATLRKAEEHAKGGKKEEGSKEKEDGSGKPPSAKGFWRTMLGL